jgi:hypothetical protein
MTVAFLCRGFERQCFVVISLPPNGIRFFICGLRESPKSPVISFLGVLGMLAVGIREALPPTGLHRRPGVNPFTLTTDTLYPPTFQESKQSAVRFNPEESAGIVRIINGDNIDYVDINEPILIRIFP